MHVCHLQLRLKQNCRCRSLTFCEDADGVLFTRFMQCSRVLLMQCLKRLRGASTGLHQLLVLLHTLFEQASGFMLLLQE